MPIILKRLLITLSFLILFIFLIRLAPSGFVWLRSWSPFLDDGPFLGKPTTSAPIRTPDQSIIIYGNNTLNVFDPSEEDSIPIVLLKNHNNETKWCIHVTAQERVKVGKLRFQDFRRFPFFTPRVRGTVQSTYGNEPMWWLINSDGSLQGYWFSW